MLSSSRLEPPTDQQRLSALLEYCPLAIVEWTPDFTITSWNPLAEGLFGYTQAEMVGQSFDRLIPDSARAHIDRVVQMILVEGIEQSSINENITKSGKTLLCEWHSTILRNDENQIVGILSTVRDVSEQVAALHDRAHMKKELADIKFALDQSSIVVITDQRGVITYVNDHFCSISKYSRAELLGNTHQLINSGHHRAAFFQQMWQTIRSGKVWRGEIKNRAKDGTFYWVDTTIVPFLDSKGKPYQYVAIRNDITDSKSTELALQQSERQLRQQTQELEQTLKKLQLTQAQMVHAEKMSSLGQLVAGVAHEINNPVNFIHGNVKYIREYVEDLLQIAQICQQSELTSTVRSQLEEIDLAYILEDFPKLLNSMQMGTDRIREIVKSLRTFSRMDEAAFKDIDLHEGIESTLMILQHRLKATPHRGTIQVVKEYGALPKVECYASQLNQVIMNILANAIEALEDRFAQQRDCQPVIEIQTVASEDHVSIHIRDNAGGIPAAVRDRIFDPFFTTKPIGQGTGMGLAISYQIVTEHHDGTLTCHSTEHQGTEFVIQIPRDLGKKVKS